MIAFYQNKKKNYQNKKKISLSVVRQLRSHLLQGNEAPALEPVPHSEALVQPKKRKKI